MSWFATVDCLERDRLLSYLWDKKRLRISKETKKSPWGWEENRWPQEFWGLGSDHHQKWCQAPRLLTSAALVTLGDQVSNLMTGKVQSFLCQWKSSLAKKTYKDTYMQYQVRHRKISMLLIWTRQGRCTSHHCPDIKKNPSVGPGHESPKQQLRNGDYYKLSLPLLSGDSLIEDDFCYSVILIYYFNWTSKLNWRQQRSNWSFPAGWSWCILKTKTNIFYNNTEWPPWFNKR